MWFIVMYQVPPRVVRRLKTQSCNCTQYLAWILERKPISAGYESICFCILQNTVCLCKHAEYVYVPKLLANWEDDDTDCQQA